MAPLVVHPPAWGCRDNRDATSTGATEIAAASLDRLLSGGNPGGVAELKAMQDRVRKLTDQLMKCTVGVQVGAAQGSGVIISKDGYVLTAAHVAGSRITTCCSSCPMAGCSAEDARP